MTTSPQTAVQNTEQNKITAPASHPDLPTPADLPNATVVIYDGKCRFCTRQVERLHRWDGKGRLAFISLHDPQVAVQYPELSYDQLIEQMYVVRPDGSSFGGAAAFRVITRILPRFWVLVPLLHIPFSLPLWQWMYLQVARRRYEISKKQGDVCDGDTCDIHFGKKS